MKIRYSLLAAMLVVFCAAAVHAQSRQDAKYKERAEEIRAEVWGWSLPAFKNRTVPDSMNKESGVVMARHIDISASGRKRKREYTRIVREMVKINDKAALEEYSEFNYQQFSRSLMSYPVTETRVLGVRIIKPDGAVKYVNADDAVATTDDKTDKQRKLAISDLQVGDIIDYFVCMEQVLEGYQTFLPETFVLGDDKPILSYSIHTEVADRFVTQYRSSNGAPEFKRKYADGTVELDMLVRNIPALPMSLWMSPIRQVPLIRMNLVEINDPSLGGPTKGTVMKNPATFRTREAATKHVLGSRSGTSYATVPFLGDTKELIANYKKANRDATDRDIVTFAYYAIRYLALYRVNAGDKILVGQGRNYSTLNQRRFLLYLNYILVKNDIPTDFVLVTSKYGPDQDEVMLPGDYEWMLKTREKDPLFISVEGMFTNASYIASEFEGQHAYVVEGAKVRREDGFADQVDLPQTTPAENAKLEKMSISLDDNMQLLNIDRTTTVKGHLKHDDQQSLLLFEEYYEEERKNMGVKTSFMEEFADSRRNKSLAEEYANAFAKARKDWKDIFKGEIKGTFDVEPKEVSKFGITKMGLQHAKPDFVYTTRFSLEGLVKRAGNNYILDAGKLIGGQLTLKPSQRDRKVDVYMPFARSFEYSIDIQIPAGYTVEGLDKLQQNVDTDAASFVVNGAVNGGKLTLNIKKTYKHAFEKAAQWGDLVKVIDAALAFQDAKLLLKKA
ncbi:DUF3857 domain-containing protein [Chitinophaga horti]|uniref:DUF3857 domain-containing protein n=1 Tax=Chitinophaga horti TaxID=2920382 RepID=A0ABY6J2A7_9BACT|nr:DUF3857 domain-containing protein [Chitinophaga horti]UYQ92444.1 DUF3857 domain-containing protein [Chitinophaga horti]